MKAADVSKGVFNVHFDSKDALAAELIKVNYFAFRIDIVSFLTNQTGLL